MVEVNEKDEAPKSNSGPEEDVGQPANALSILLSDMEEQDEDEDEEEYEEEEYEEEEEEDDDDDDEYEEEDEEPEEVEGGDGEKVNDGGKALVVANNEGLETDKKANKEKATGRQRTNEEKAAKVDEKKAKEPKTSEELGKNSESKLKRPKPGSRNTKKDAEDASVTLAANGDKPESSGKKKASKRVESMGMVFMCSSKTKSDCFRYKILGLPENKKDQVAKIYKGMRLFLFDVDLRLMYGIFKAAAPGGYNIEPKAFKSEFPSQVRFTMLDDCLPLAEEKFKDVIKENYYTRNKFEGLLKSEQVKKLCRLFVETGRGGPRHKASAKPRRTRRTENYRTKAEESRRNRADDLHTSRARERRKRRVREEERRPRSPPGREKRRYTDSPPGREKRRYADYDDRPPVVYEREPPVPRYRQPLPPVMGSPVRLYAYERPLDIPPYRVPEPHTYRVLDRDRDHDREREPYHVYSREPPPPYRDTVYTLPPEYHLVSRDYHHPAAVQPPPEYRLSGGSRVANYRDVELASDYRSLEAPLPEYRSRTHYRY